MERDNIAESGGMKNERLGIHTSAGSHSETESDSIQFPSVVTSSGIQKQTREGRNDEYRKNERNRKRINK